MLNVSIILQLILSDIIITYTEDYAEYVGLKKRFKKKIYYVFPFIDEPQEDSSYTNKLQKLKKNEIWVGFAGRVASEKGIEYAVDAIVQLKKTIPSIALVLAGPTKKDVIGENTYYDKVIQRIAKSGIIYHILGSLSEAELGSFYHTIDVLALPSVNNTEAFGIVQVEAMLYGTPVVVTDLPGLRIPVSLSKMGLVVKPQNADALSRAIKQIIEHKQTYTNANLIRNAKNIFDSSKVFETYFSLILT